VPGDCPLQRRHSQQQSHSPNIKQIIFNVGIRARWHVRLVLESGFIIDPAMVLMSLETERLHIPLASALESISAEVSDSLRTRWIRTCQSGHRSVRGIRVV
jgi:hypothetical protein